MIAVPIGPRVQRFVTAAAPAYLAAHGRPAHPRDLLDHACIRHRFASGVVPPWEFERAGEVVRIMPNGPLIANVAELQVAAAVAGLGIVSAFEGFLAPAFAAGTLEPILRGLVAELSGAVPLHGRATAHASAIARVYRSPASGYAGSVAVSKSTSAMRRPSGSRPSPWRRLQRRDRSGAQHCLIVATLRAAGNGPA